MKKYVYFVAYWHTDGHSARGFGNVEIVRNAPIEHYETLAQITTVLEAQQDGRGVVVLSLTLLRTEDA